MIWNEVPEREEELSRSSQKEEVESIDTVYPEVSRH